MAMKPSQRKVPLLLGYKKNKAIMRGKDKKVTLNLTSMIDMFTILVVFLLKSYSAEGQLITISDSLTLPQSVSAETVELNLDIVVSRDVILVDGDPVYEIGEQLIDGSPIPLLVDRLSDHMEYTLASRGNTGEDMEINIQADVATPALLLQKVMASCGAAGYVTQNLAVIKAGGE